MSRPVPFVSPLFREEMTIIEKIKDIDEHWKALLNSILIVSLTGLLPSIYYSDWEWFSRSGALVIIYGVYIVWLDYQGGIDSALSKIEFAAKEKFGELTDELSKTINQIKISNKKMYQTMEFLILGFGTLIWGYGDLVGELF